MAIATAMAVVFLVLATLDFAGYLANPYVGLLVFVTIPILFLLALLLIPAGAWWSARRARPEGSGWAVIDLRNRQQRTVFVAVIVLTLVNIAIVSMASYGAVHAMESVAFCGQVCQDDGTAI